MLRHRRILLGGALVAAALLSLTAARSGGPSAANAGTYAMRVAPLKLQSIGVMNFGPDATLYVADSRAGAVYAIDVGDTARDTSTSGIQIKAIDDKIASALGVPKDQIRIHDMVAHPVSQSLYFSVSRGRGADAKPVIVRVTKRDKQISVVPLEMIRHARVELPDAASRDTTLPWEGAPRSLTITHLASSNGDLYVAGLSNEGFKSTLRRVPLPFGKAAVVTKVEIFHTSHDRYETASPIESLVPLTLSGRSVVLASYTCSPMAVFERDALNGSGVVRGKTIAELGGGNRPLDMIVYTSPNNGKQYVMVANSHRTLMRFDVADLAAAPNMTTPVRQAYQPGGVPYLPISSYGVLQLDAYNARNVVVLQRNPADGSLEVDVQGLGWL